ncbi:MAG TPA: MBL fold metallo-hydrolase [Caldilineaceae bacterium]|nr:MBL fold metallo-hydrolase [Caldilineaceae bacterium]
MVYTVQVGSIRCHILSDGLNVADGGGFFGVVPRVMWQRVIQPNERNQVPNDLRTLLIESDAGLILVDTGIGDKHTPKQRQILGLDDRRLRLVQSLAQAGFRPEDVDVVLLTHFHNDHAGGGTRWDTPDGSPGPVVPTFPRARYLGQRIDLADASFPNERTAATYIADNWQPLLACGQFEIVDGPQRLGRAVRTDIAPGHTAALQVVWVEDGGEALLFLGDACSWAVHLERLAWVPSYDIYPMTSIETKRRLRHEAQEKEALLVFQHDPQVIAGRLVPGARGPEVQPILTRAPWADPLQTPSTPLQPS